MGVADIPLLGQIKGRLGWLDARQRVIAENVAPHKKVRRVEFIDAIPKSSSGKILRKDLRAHESAASGSRKAV